MLLLITDSTAENDFAVFPRRELQFRFKRLFITKTDRIDENEVNVKFS